MTQAEVSWLIGPVKNRHRRLLSLLKRLFSSLDPISSADNRYLYLPTQFTDTLGDVEADPIPTNAIMMSVYFKGELSSVHVNNLKWLPLFVKCKTKKRESTVGVRWAFDFTWTVFFSPISLDEVNDMKPFETIQMHP